MPHRCTDCGRRFEDGSTEMLSGCPNCGGTTFQFYPAGTDPEPTDAEPPDPPDPPGSSVARTVGSAATTVRDLVGDSEPEPPEPPRDGDSSPDAPGSESEPAAPSADGSATDRPPEDSAQASARSEPIEDLPPAPERSDDTHRFDPPETGSESDESTAVDDRPDLSELREELNDQFESIKVLQPGRYELNLMELYDREEYIIALQEDGKYTIQLPEQWNSDLE